MKESPLKKYFVKSALTANGAGPDMAPDEISYTQPPPKLETPNGITKPPPPGFQYPGGLSEEEYNQKIQTEKQPLGHELEAPPNPRFVDGIELSPEQIQRKKEVAEMERRQAAWQEKKKEERRKQQQARGPQQLDGTYLNE